MPAVAERLYVVALAEPGLPRRILLSGRHLHALTIESITAIVEKRSERPEATPSALQEQHTIVTGLSARVPALLPLRFGSLLTSADLQSIITANKETIVSALARVRGHVQMTVRVFGEPDARRPTDDRGSGAAFLASRQRQAHYLPAEAATIRRVLGDLVAEERMQPGEGGLRVTIYHLVAQSAVDAYLERASSLQALVAPHQVAVSGPWPVFAFAPELF
jgi:hypothetical protein